MFFFEDDRNHFVAFNIKPAFSLDGCRIPDMKIVALVLKTISVYNHSFKFGPACDAEGALPVSLESPFPMDLRIRELADVARITGTVQFRMAIKSLNEAEQFSSVSGAAAHDSSGSVMARFSLNHQCSVTMDLMKQSLSTKDNVGLVKVTEFRGKPVNFEHKFLLDHLDGRAK